MSSRTKLYSILRNNLIGVLGVSLVIGFILIELTGFGFLKIAISYLSILFILLSLRHLQGVVAIIVFSMMILIAIFLLGNNNAFEVIKNGVRVNLALAAIFIATPLLGVPVRAGNYIESLKLTLTKYKNNTVLFYLGTSILTHFLSVVLNIGAVIINHYLVGASNVKSNRLIATALNLGFSTSVFWAPFFSAMALIISHLHIKWETIAQYSFTFAMLSIIIACITNLKHIRNESNNLKTESRKHSEESLYPTNMSVRKTGMKVFELIIVIALTLTLTLVLEKLPKFNMVISICLVSIFFPLIWCLIRGKMAEYKNEFTIHIESTIPKLRQEITLFLTAGLFSAVFVQSPWNEKIVHWFILVANHSNTLMVMTISLLIILTAIVGIHPIIIITILVTGIDPVQIGFSKEYFALILLISWGLATSVSPSTALSSIIASLLNEDLLKVSIYWNLKYVIIMLIILPFYLGLIAI